MKKIANPESIRIARSRFLIFVLASGVMYQNSMADYLHSMESVCSRRQATQNLRLVYVQNDVVLLFRDQTACRFGPNVMSSIFVETIERITLNRGPKQAHYPSLLIGMGTLPDI